MQKFITEYIYWLYSLWKLRCFFYINRILNSHIFTGVRIYHWFRFYNITTCTWFLIKLHCVIVQRIIFPRQCFSIKNRSFIFKKNYAVMLIHIFDFCWSHKLSSCFLVIIASVISIVAIAGNIYRRLTQQFRYGFLRFDSTLSTTSKPEYRHIIVNNFRFFTLI